MTDDDMDVVVIERLKAENEELRQTVDKLTRNEQP